MTGFGKNVIPRRAHKERAQPLGRVSRHGLLEKKRDYKVRAKHSNRKQARLKLLREKAAFRNQDEFYHAMENSRTSKGISLKQRDVESAMASRSGEERLLASSRDGTYVEMKASIERGKLEKLKKGLHFLDDAQNVPQRQHIIFVSDDEMEEREEYDSEDEEFRDAEEEGDDEEEASSSGDDIDENEEVEAESGSDDAQEDDGNEGGESEEADEDEDETGKLDADVLKARGRAYREHAAREVRLAKLNSVVQDVRMEKKLLGKGMRYKVRDADPVRGTPAVFKWRQQRKK